MKLPKNVNTTPWVTSRNENYNRFYYQYLRQMVLLYNLHQGVFVGYPNEECDREDPIVL